MADPKPVGHPINHIDEPGSCLAVIVDSTQQVRARLCAGYDMLHWGTRTFLPDVHSQQRNFTAPADLAGKSDADLCAMLVGAETTGFSAIDWKIWIEVFKPVILELIRRWLLS